MLQSKYVTSQSLPSQTGEGAAAAAAAAAGTAAADGAAAAAAAAAADGAAAAAGGGGAAAAAEFGVSVFNTDTSDNAADGIAVFGCSDEVLGLNRLQCKQKKRWK